MNETKVIAHRGYSKIATENTIGSFLLAAKQDYFYGVELDIHLTKDNKYVVFHDNTTGRLAKVDVAIKDKTYDELKDIDLYNKRNEKYELKIPLLSEVLDLMKKNNKHTIIEIKPELNEQQITELLSYLYLNEYKDITIISFRLVNLVLIRKYNKKINLQYLTSKHRNINFLILERYKLGYDIQFPIATKDNVKYLKDNKIPINVWTVNKKEVFDKMVSMNVDFITTDGF